VPDAGYKPHKEETDLVSPADDQVGSNITPKNPGDKFEDMINQEYSGGEAGRLLRKAERDTAKAKASGESSGDGGSSSKSGGVKDTLLHGIGGKKGLKSKEEAAEGGGFFNANKDKKDGGKKKGSWKTRVAAGGAGGLVGIGGFFGITSIVQGPLSVVHFGQLISQLTQADNQGQNEGRMLQHLRYMYNLKKGTPERSRLGWLGNKYADTIEAKFEAKGVKPIRGGGLGNYQTGFSFDPEEYGATEGLVDRSPEAVQRYLQGKGIATDVVNGRLEAKATTTLEGRLLMSKTFRAVGYRGVIALPYRFAAKRAGWSLHPLSVADRATLEGVDKGLAKLKAFRDRWSKNVADGTTGTNTSATGADDPNKPKGTDDVASTIEDLNGDVNGVREGELQGNKGPLEAFAGKLSVKAGAGVAGVTALVCMLKGIADMADKIALANVILPRERVYAAMSATAGQVQHGDDYAHDSPVPEDEVGEVAGWLYDGNTQTNAADARPIQALLGLNKSGTDLPDDMKVNPKGNFITQFLSQIPNIDDICAAVNSTIGVVVLTVLGLVTAPITTLVTVAALGVAGQLGFFQWVAEWLAGTVVPGIPQGELLGNVAMYGGHDASTLDALGSGASIVPQSTVSAISRDEAEYQRESFQSESLATRMLDINDRRSFISQVYDSTAEPTAQATVTKFASGFLNMGQATLKTFGTIFTSKASAAADGNFTFDTPTARHTAAQVSDLRVADPFANADAVAGTYDPQGNLVPGILDSAQGQDFIARAKICQGVTLQMTADPDHEGKSMWGVTPPATGEIPTYKDIMDPANNCNDTGEAWLRVQDFIWDSQLGNAYGCEEGNTQACIDVGIKSASGAGSAGAPTCASAATPPAQIAGYKLVKCEDFDGTSIPAGWSAYSGGGGNTVVGAGRNASQCVVANGLLTLIQNADGSTCGTSSDFKGLYGYWEVKMRAYSTSGGGSAPHPVLILWPDAEDWGSGGGELDYVETDIGKPGVDVYLHCAHPGQASSGNCYETHIDVDQGQFHTYGFKWEAGAMTGYVDGVQKYTTSGNGSLPPRSMHQTVQLDNLTGRTPVSPGKMEVDWVHQYSQ
jgi:hypothetical protein